jgi:PIN domain nuclease of toxin-antitoxin system
VRLLLDSHVALWWLADSSLLGLGARTAIIEADEVFWSVVTPWELGSKRSIGKISYPDGLTSALLESGFVELPIVGDHAIVASALPLHHRDPFDRMLIAQAQVEALEMVSADRSLDAYGVARLDARS